jgi:polysaccharide biosynthesis protein PslH
MEELLFLAHRIPYPPNKGDKIRSYHLLRHLSERYRIHLGTFVDDPEDWVHVETLGGLCTGVCALALAPRRARLRSLAGLLHGGPLSLPYYRDQSLQRWVDAVLARPGMRRVLVFSSSMAQYVEQVRDDTRVVVDFVDVDSDKWRQYAQRLRGPLGWVYAREARTLLGYERALAGRASASVFVSETEAELFRALAPATAARVHAVENGVDTEHFRPDSRHPNPYAPEERVLVFTGAMDYWPNVDAVEWFGREVFPAIRARDPHAVLCVVGGRPDEAVRRLAAQPGVRVTGAVADVRPYLAHAHAAVAPLRIARGVQNKVLEAMAMARPIIASPSAMDGIRACPSLQGAVAREAGEWIERCLELLSAGAEHRDSLGAQGRGWVLSHYAWAEKLRPWEDLLEATEPRRRAEGAA